MELSKLLLALMSSSSSSSSCLFLIWLLIINGNSSLVESSHQVYPQLQSPAANDVDPLYRTGFHFQPPRNWINGPMYYNGVYHVFYQYNPEAAVWGNIVWAHSVSRDMINWDAVKHALYPSKPFDINGCWSGSATILPGNKPVILYTGVDRLERQVQNIAFPANLSDPYLQDWVKPDYNPLIAPTLDMNVSSFRDPTTAWWNHGQWRILVGGRIGGNTGTAWLYRSTDFKKWTKAKNPLHSVPNTGMWECPDFYPVAIKGQSGLDASVVGPNVKHVLKVSLDENRCDYYTVGRYDMRDDTHIPQTTSVDGRRGLRYDYGNFYGSKSFFDSESKRRIIWGWANESSDPTDDVKKGWAGIMAIPRTVWLDANGRQLLQWPVKEVEQLRMNPVHELSQRPLNMGDRVEINGITAVQADVEVTFSFANASLDKAELFDPRWENLDAQEICALKGSKVQGGLGPFGLMTLATKDIEEYTPVFFSIFKTRDGRNVVTMCSDASSSSLGSKLYKPSFAGFVDVDLRPGTLSLRTLIDRSVVETFGAGGKTVILSRVYPTKAVGNNAHLFAFNNGAQPITIKHLSAWSMKTPRRMDNMHF